LAVGAGGVWVTLPDALQVVRVGPRAGRIDLAVPVGAGPRAIAATSDAVWVANGLDATVSRVDPVRGHVVATTPVGGTPVALAADRRGVWVAVRESGAVLRLGGANARVVRRVALGGAPAALERVDGGVAVAVAPSAGDHAGGTLRVRAIGPLQSLDPAACCVYPPELLAILYDGLTGFERTGSSTSGLVADLAVALPRPTDGGRTYTFTLRPGLRYSTGAPVRASDFRRAAERVLRARNEGANVFDHLAGIDGCLPGEPCDLRDAIVADDGARTVRFRLSAPDPSFLFKLASPGAAPVPHGTPAIIGPAALPGTGPYRVRQFSPSRTVILDRNPHFREWSPSAQPAGRADRIEFAFTERPGDGADVLGRADLLLGTASPVAVERLSIEHPGLVHVHAVASLDWFSLNATSPPFDDIRARKALNLAVDRAAAAAVFGGRGSAIPTCQAVPPGLSGHVRYCPYTRTPTPAGRWSEPDLAGARRLVARTRHRGATVNVWTFDEWPGNALADVMTRALRELGYRPRLRFFGPKPPPPDQIQAAGAGAILQYPTAALLFEGFLSCHGQPASGSVNLGNRCDPRIVEPISSATRLEARAPHRARRLWAAADRRLVDQAVWVPLVNEARTDVTATRLGNYAWSPTVGALVGQMWVR
jgi:ABC-type transport system substrate-binding protein